MPGNTSEILNGIISALLIVWPCCTISFMMKKRPHFLMKLSMNMILACCFAIVAACKSRYFTNSWELLLGMHLLSVAELFLCVQCDLKLLIYLKTWGVIFYHLSLQIPGLIVTMIANRNITPEIWSLGWIASLIIIPVIIFCVFRNVENKPIEDLSIGEIVQAIITVALIVILNRFIFIYYRKLNWMTNIVFLFQFFSVACAILILYIQLETHYQQAMRRETQIREHIWEQEKKHYEQSKEQIDLINRKCHDLKHQIAALRHISDQTVLDQNIAELRVAVTMFDEINQTGNAVIGTLLAEKRLQYTEHGVTLNYVVDGTAIGFIDTVDLYILLGNAFDNAFESLCRTEQNDKKIIDVRIFRDRNILRMIIRNDFRGELVMENGLPISSRGKDGSHGIGMKSMRQIVQKYQGELVVEVEQNQFILKIMIPIPPQ